VTSAAMAVTPGLAASSSCFMREINVRLPKHGQNDPSRMKQKSREHSPNGPRAIRLIVA
jgi:hypothetical protein